MLTLQSQRLGDHIVYICFHQYQSVESYDRPSNLGVGTLIFRQTQTRNEFKKHPNTTSHNGLLK